MLADERRRGGTRRAIRNLGGDVGEALAVGREAGKLLRAKRSAGSPLGMIKPLISKTCASQTHGDGLALLGDEAEETPVVARSRHTSPSARSRLGPPVRHVKRATEGRTVYAARTAAGRRPRACAGGATGRLCPSQCSITCRTSAALEGASRSRSSRTLSSSPVRAWPPPVTHHSLSVSSCGPIPAAHHSGVRPAARAAFAGSCRMPIRGRNGAGN